MLTQVEQLRQVSKSIKQLHHVGQLGANVHEATKSANQFASELTLEVVEIVATHYVEVPILGTISTANSSLD